MQILDPVEVKVAVEKVILDEIGKVFYEEKKLQNVRRRFNLTRVTLQDIMRECGTEAEVYKCYKRVFTSAGKPHKPLTPKALLRFIAVARYGRCAIKKEGYCPQRFVDDATLLLATNLYKDLSRRLAET